MSGIQTRVRIARHFRLPGIIAGLVLALSAAACPEQQAVLSLPGALVDVALSGNYLLTGGSNLRLFSLEQPVQPAPVDSVLLDFAPLAFEALDGAQAFCVLGADRLVIVDFSVEPGSVIQGELPLGETALSLAVDGNRAWIGMQSGGILPVDLADPTQPLAGNRMDTAGSTRDLAYRDGVLVAADDSALRLYYAPAGQPLTVASAALTGSSGLWRLAIHGDVVACMQAGFGVYILDIDNPAAPQQRAQLSEFLALTYTKEMAFSGNDLLLAGRYLFAYNLVQPNHPDLLGIAATTGLQGLALSVAGDRAYVLSSVANATVSHLQVMYVNCNPEADYAFDFEADTGEVVGLNGGTAVFHLNVDNLGEYPGHYTVETGASPWPVSLHQAGTDEPLQGIPEIAVDGTFDFDLHVQVPEEPEVFTRLVTVTVQSTDDPSRSRLLNLLVHSSCRVLDELPGRLEHPGLPAMDHLGDGEWIDNGRLAWLAPEMPAVLLVDPVEGTLIGAPLPLAPGEYRGLAWNGTGDGSFWTSRRDTLLQLDPAGGVLGLTVSPALWPPNGARVAGMGVDEAAGRLWILRDGPVADDMLVYDISLGTPVLESLTPVEWNLDASQGVTGLDFDETSHQMLCFGLAGGELECLTDIGGGLVSARGDFCPSGITAPAGLALAPEGTVYTPFVDEGYFRIRRYAPPCLFVPVAGSGAERPAAFGLQAAPNPFNPSTRIRFELDQAGPVRLEVFNLAGQRVTYLLDGVLPAGVHEVDWQPGAAASGIYFLRLVGPAATGADEALLQLLLMK